MSDGLEELPQGWDSILERAHHYPLRDEQERLTHFIGVQSDVTEQMIATDELQRSEEKLRQLVEQSADGVTMTNERGLLIEWNSAMESIAGLSLNIQGFLHKPLTAKEMLRVIRHALDAKGGEQGNTP